MLGVNDNKVVGDGGGRADEMIKNLFKSKKRNNIFPLRIGATGESVFLTSDARETFNL